MDYCDRCNLAFGLVEKAVVVVHKPRKVMHIHCYIKYMNELQELTRRARERKPPCIRDVDGVTESSRTRKWWRKTT